MSRWTRPVASRAGARWPRIWGPLNWWMWPGVLVALARLGPRGPDGQPLPPPSRVPASATPDGDGVIVGIGPVTVEVYIDFQCPFCRQFEELAGPALAELVRHGDIRMIYHPMNLLDEMSTTQYSTRAAAAAGCAADAGRFAKYAHTLFAHQPPEGGPGLTDDELIELGLLEGLPGTRFVRCVRAGTYRDWPSYVTAAALGRRVAGTPSVFVDRHPVPARPGPILHAVHAVAG